MALAVPLEGEAFLVDENSPGGWFEDGSISMTRLRNFFDGWVELVTFDQPIKIAGKEYAYMAVNEEGRLMNLPLNVNATAIMALMIGETGDAMIVGNAVLLEKSEIE